MLEVELCGRHHLEFRCRVGHRFTLRELLASKERRVEDGLWSCITALEELVALLGDAEGLSEPAPADAPGRRARARQALTALRRVLQENEPVILDPVDPEERVDGRTQSR